jgi:hypothetical protein
MIKLGGTRTSVACIPFSIDAARGGYYVAT